MLRPILSGILIGALISGACRDGSQVEEFESSYDPSAIDTTVAPEERMAALFSEYDLDRIAPPQFDSTAAREWVEATFSSLSLEQKVGQLIIVEMAGGGIRGLFSDPERLVDDYFIGGFLVPRLMTPEDVFRRTSRLQQRSGVPLFFAADYERGVGRFNNPLTELPSNMAVGATRDTVFAAAMGRLTAIESRAIGINLVFAPVVDVNNNPANPIINIRSYGQEGELVGRMAAAYVREAQGHGTLTTLKHFPGHGDTAVDTHVRMAVVESDRASLDEVELKPYEIILRGNADPAGVMSAHLWMQALDPEAGPATFSGRILTDLLREELGFEGFIVTDDVKMGALQGRYSPEERILNPLLAGADVILTPADPVRAIQVITNAVRQGRLPEASVDASVRRVLWAKARAGAYREAAVDRDLLDYLMEVPRGAAPAQAIADRAVTVLKSGDALPLGADTTLFVHLTNYRGSESIAAAMDLLERRHRQLGVVHAFRFDAAVPAARRDQVLAAASHSGVVVVALYLRLIAGRGDAALLPEQTALVRALIDLDVPLVLATFGNPYAVSAFPDADAHVVAYDQSLETVRAVHRVLIGELPPQGTLPIEVEPYRYGDGLDSL